MHPRAKKLAGCTNTYGPLEQLGIQNEEDEEDEDDNDAGRDELLLLGTGCEELARTVESFAATCVKTDRYVHLHHGAVKLETCTYRIATMLNLLTLTLQVLQDPSAHIFRLQCQARGACEALRSAF